MRIDKTESDERGRKLPSDECLIIKLPHLFVFLYCSHSCTIQCEHHPAVTRRGLKEDE